MLYVYENLKKIKIKKSSKKIIKKKKIGLTSVGATPSTSVVCCSPTENGYNSKCLKVQRDLIMKICVLCEESK